MNLVEKLQCHIDKINEGEWKYINTGHGYDTFYVVNPTGNELRSIIKDYKIVRCLIRYGFSNDIYFWPAKEMTHAEFCDKILHDDDYYGEIQIERPCHISKESLNWLLGEYEYYGTKTEDDREFLCDTVKDFITSIKILKTKYHCTIDSRIPQVLRKIWTEATR